MVGQRFKRNLAFIKSLIREKSNKNLRKLIENATDDEIASLMDANYNILKFNFPLRPSQKRKLAGYAKSLRKLYKKKSIKSGRKILQKGNGPMLAALLVPVLTEVASRLYSHLSSR